MRVAVLRRERRVAEQTPTLDEKIDDDAVGLGDAFAGEQGADRVVVAAVGADRVVDGQIVLESDLVIFVSVARRDMHDARAGVERDVFGRNDRHVPREKGVDRPTPDEVAPAHRAQDLPVAVRRARSGRRDLTADGCNERLGETNDARANPAKHVGCVRVDRDGPIGRQRPRRGRPHREAHVEPTQRGHDLVQRSPAGGRRKLRPKSDVNRRTAARLVFDFRLGERRPVVRAPVDGALASIQQAPFRDRCELPQLGRSVGG